MSPDTAHYLANSEATPAVARFFIAIFGGLVVGGGLLLFLALRWWQRRRARAAAESARDPGRPLLHGEAVLGGRVLHEGAEAPVSITIVQKGEEWSRKGTWRHAWRETGRSVVARPFQLVRRSDERVRVEPDDRVFLVDQLDGLRQTGAGSRERRATLRAGESVYVVGTLVRGAGAEQAGYREAATGPVLRPPRIGRMLISTAPLNERFEKRARVHRNLAIAAALTLALQQGIVLMHHNVLAVSGQAVVAPILSSRTWRVWHKPRRSAGYWVHHWQVTAEDPRGGRLREEVSYAFYAEVQSGRASYAPFLVSGAFAQVGDEPTASEGALAALVVSSLLFVVIAALVLYKTLPWYERRLVVDTGSGRLDGSTIEVR